MKLDEKITKKIRDILVDNFEEGFTKTLFFEDKVPEGTDFYEISVMYANGPSITRGSIRRNDKEIATITYDNYSGRYKIR